MATRSGKANTIQPGIGAASPRIRLFRSAGFASVWDWGDDADNGDSIGTAISCDADCVVGVTAEVSFRADSALAVNGAYAQSVDTGVVTTRAIGVSLDQRLSIYEVTAFARDFDVQAVTLTAREAVFDERVGVFNALIRGFDAGAEIVGLLAKQYDFSLVSCALRTVCADLLITVPNPTLLAADTQVCISGAASVRGDQRITVRGSIRSLADCLQSIWRGVERRADIGAIVGERISLGSDQAWRVDNTDAINCDVATLVACLVALGADVRIRTSARLAPDADLVQRVYAVAIAESHPIQV